MTERSSQKNQIHKKRNNSANNYPKIDKFIKPTNRILLKDKNGLTFRVHSTSSQKFKNA